MQEKTCIIFKGVHFVAHDSNSKEKTRGCPARFGSPKTTRPPKKKAHKHFANSGDGDQGQGIKFEFERDLRFRSTKSNRG